VREGIGDYLLLGHAHADKTRRQFEGWHLLDLRAFRQHEYRVAHSDTPNPDGSSVFRAWAIADFPASFVVAKEGPPPSEIEMKRAERQVKDAAKRERQAEEARERRNFQSALDAFAEMDAEAEQEQAAARPRAFSAEQVLAMLDPDWNPFAATDEERARDRAAVQRFLDASKRP
jgi:hypothetical protein